MTVRQYIVARRTFTKVRDETPKARGPRVHVVERGQFWQGDKGWNHRAMCGRSVSGNPLTTYPAKNTKVTCPDCRAAIQALKEAA